MLISSVGRVIEMAQRFHPDEQSVTTPEAKPD